MDDPPIQDCLSNVKLNGETKMNNKLFIALTFAACLSLSGCQQINDLANGNKAANTNTASNGNTVANSNANSNSNTSADQADPSVNAVNKGTDVDTKGAVFTKKANVKQCEAESGWRTCIEMASPSIKIFGSRLASESALNGVANAYIEITKRFNEKYPKDRFNGYKIYLTNGEPWPELSKISPVGTMWTDQTGPMSGDFLRGGTNKDLLWIDEQMICKTGIRTRNEAGTPDNDKRALDQVVHEFGHAIDFKFNLDQTIRSNYIEHPNFPATERFPWSIQNWFGTPDGSLTPKEDAVMKDIFSSRISLTCEGYQPSQPNQP